jgi:trimeric autotransporter adhesin
MADIRTSSLGGVPKGETADRPSSPSIGDVFYNGTLGCLEIYTSQGWVANSAPPGIPTIGTITYSGTGKTYNNSSASVDFTPGEGGGLPNSYRATSTPGGFSTSSSSSPIVVSGLQSGISYTFSVTGTNNFGTSASSANSSSITAVTVPDAPVIGTLSYISNTSLSLTFTPGATGGSSITNYKYSTDGVNYTALSPAQTTSPLTISGLTSFQFYSFYIKAVNTNGDSVASAISNSAYTGLATVTGGTLTSDSTYYYRTFTANSNLIVSNASISMDILAVGGGGSSGDGTNVCAGGGAGGLVYETGRSFVPQTYSIQVGAGGGAGTSSSNGTNSTILNIIAVGGGRGATEQSAATSGGSGGGAAWSAGYTTPGSSTQSASYSGFGNSGGLAGASGAYGSGGGGGAGAAGGNGSNQPGNGGVGRIYNEFGSATSTGHLVSGNYYYAGGGGGGGWTPSSSDSVGGFGGGGKGSSNIGGSTAAAAGTANTGGGGGGPGVGGTATAKAGGSGIVIVRYLKTMVS